MKPLIITAAIGFDGKPECMHGLRTLIASCTANATEAEVMVLTERPLPLPPHVTQWPFNGPHVHPVCSRWFAIAKLLEFQAADRPVLLVDARDTVINTPLYWGEDLVFTAEDTRYKLGTEASNASWLYKWFGFAPWMPFDILCAGVMGGTAGLLHRHIAAMCGAMAARNWLEFGADQVAHNLCAWYGPSESRIVLPNGTKALHCVLADKEQWTFVDGRVTAVNGTKPQPSIVHQYDRWPELKLSILEKYGNF